AAVIDGGAIVFLFLFAPVILAMRWRVPIRLGGVLLYAIGCAPVILLHAVLVVPITGDLRIGGTSHPELAANVPGLAAQAIPASANDPLANESSPILRDDAADEDVNDDPLWISIGHGIGRVLAAIFGAHGLL